MFTYTRNKWKAKVTKLIVTLNTSDDAVTEMVNIYLRDRYKLPRVTTWQECTVEELKQIHARYSLKLDSSDI